MSRGTEGRRGESAPRRPSTRPTNGRTSTAGRASSTYQRQVLQGVLPQPRADTCVRRPAQDLNRGFKVRISTALQQRQQRSGGLGTQVIQSQERVQVLPFRQGLQAPAQVSWHLCQVFLDGWLQGRQT